MIDLSESATTSSVSLPVALGFPAEDRFGHGAFIASTPSRPGLLSPRNFSYPLSIPRRRDNHPEDYRVWAVDIDSPFVPHSPAKPPTKLLKKRGVLFGTISSRKSEDSNTPKPPNHHKRGGSLLRADSKAELTQQPNTVIKKKQSFSRRHRLTRSVDLSYFSSRIDTSDPACGHTHRFVRVSDYWFDMMEPTRQETLTSTPLRPMASSASSGRDSDDGKKQWQACSPGLVGFEVQSQVPVAKAQSRMRTHGWRSKMHKMTGWLTISEPSTNALKQHKRTTFQKAGVSLNDPQARGKLHLPIGDIPAEAIRPSGPGPSPEDIVLRQGSPRSVAKGW